jgi:hypothetical protein
VPRYGLRDVRHFGLFVGGGGTALGATVVGIFTVVAWTMVCTVVFFVVLFVIDKRFKFRLFFLRSS